MYKFIIHSGLGKVWTFSPAFRAENNKSTRHLSEFYMLEAEIAFAYEIEDILEIMEDLVKFCITQVLFENGHDWSIATENDTLLRVSLHVWIYAVYILVSAIRCNFLWCQFATGVTRKYSKTSLHSDDI